MARVRRGISHTVGQNFGAPRPPLQRAKLAAERQTDVNVTCDECKAIVYTVRARTWQSAPSTHLKMAAQAIRAHMEKAGCKGPSDEKMALIPTAILRGGDVIGPLVEGANPQMRPVVIDDGAPAGAVLEMRHDVDVATKSHAESFALDDGEE